MPFSFWTPSYVISFLYILLFLFSSLFPVMKWLHVGRREKKRNKSWEQRREKSFIPGLLLKIGQLVTIIISLVAITGVATASF